jgi:hypothetical protein
MGSDWTNRESEGKMSHTPGPWFVRKPKGRHDVSICEHEIIGMHESPMFGKQETKVCGIHNRIDANTTLIAAAPELLEALERTRDILFAEYGPRIYHANFAFINAAIKKARGEA